MPNVFDLTKISNLVKSRNPARILVVDTNILMNDPDPTKWSVKADGQNIFVISCASILELELILRKKVSKERTESRNKAVTATRDLANFFEQGEITEGIPVKAGWVIGVPFPKKADLKPALEDYEDIVRAFGPSDTKLLLLAGECHQSFESIPVTLITGERNLFNAVRMQGVPCHLCACFPIEGLKEAAAIKKPVDWDQVLQEIQSDTKQKAIVVEATLTAQRIAPPWLMPVMGTRQFMIAEGHGIMHAGNEVRPFLWTIPYYPQTLEPQSADDNEGLADLPPIHLDFLGEDNIPQDLFDAIVDRLQDCTHLGLEEDTCTLQSPKSVMEMLLYLEYLYKESMSANALDLKQALNKLKQEIRESEGLIDYWTDWILNTEDEDEQYASLETLLVALNNCWGIGQTYTFSIMKEQEERPAQ